MVDNIFCQIGEYWGPLEVKLQAYSITKLDDCWIILFSSFDICQQVTTVNINSFPSIKMSEKLCLQWNDFQENIKGAFGNFREDEKFNDVTLVCEDGQQVEAHKVILAASSPFFRKLLRRNKHSNPMVYMRGVKFDDLLAIMDFLYRGEANVVQENLDSFLTIAEELQLRGLMGKTDERTENLDVSGNDPSSKVLPSPFSATKSLKEHPKAERQDNKIFRADGNTVALPSYHSGDFDQLEEMVNDGERAKQTRQWITHTSSVQSVWKGGQGQRYKRSH